MCHPLVGRSPGLSTELSGECSGRHSRAAGQQLDGQLAPQIGLQPTKKRRKVATGGLGKRSVNKLRLAPIAVRRHHKPSRNLIGDFGSKVAPNNVQTEVDSRRTAGGGQDRLFIDVQNIRLDLYLRVEGSQCLNVSPMGRRTPTV